MASSSNSKRPSSSSSSSSSSKRPSFSSSSSSSNSKWRYDVFLSFRGEDTRNNFTSHLYKALDHANIETFIDDEGLPRGEEIAPELLKAIEGSRIALIVFSKTYADSKWCLDELVKIMECEKEKGQQVFPIFYHVEPSEVRNQTGIYGEAFNNHERNADEEKKKKIEQWRTALRKAGNLSGFPLQDRSEAEFIEDIIGEIRRLIPKLVDIGKNMVGMDENLKQVKSLINAQSNEVSMVGIYGIGGIGKTTIAKVVYNDMLYKYKFECRSFLENVREKSKDDPGLLELQKKLLYDILMEKDLKISNIGEGIEKIKSKCCSKKVLIVLDDVDCPRQLEFLAPNSDCFHRGSIIIVTTRNKRCLNVYESYSSYEAKGLAHEQAKELFCWKAFKQDHPIENFVDLSNRILDYAKDLPLALVVLGSFLFRRDVDEWESTLDKLKTDPLEDIQKVLQISYDGLDDKCKKLFLDIACFFKDKDEKIVTRILEGCKFHPKIGIRVLDERCLISITNGIIRMHDLLQEMGWAIVRQIDPERPGKWSRLWELQDIDSVFTRNKGTKNIEGILINRSWSWAREKRIQFTAEAFKKMNRLRLLIVEFNQMVQLSQDFELPCHDLVYFYWNSYPLESLPSNFHAENLVELNLMFSKIKHLWERNMPATKLKKLKAIVLSYSKHLVDISSISSMPNLEVLILRECSSLESLPRNLHKLKCLQILSCCGCSKIQSFPKIKEEMRSLRLLDLSKTGIKELPSSIRHLNGLEDLDLSNCENLESLPESIYNLSSLKTLQIGHNPKIFGKLWMNLGFDEHSFTYLYLTHISNSGVFWNNCSVSSLEALYPRCLSSLVELSARNSYLMVVSSLKPDILGGSFLISSLKEISLRNFHIMKGGIVSDIFRDIFHLSSLVELSLSECNLMEVGTLQPIWNLPSLLRLHVRNCNLMEGEIPNHIWHLSSLEELYLDGNHFSSLPAGISRLTNLRVLDLSHCKNLQQIPELPSSLRFLDVHCSGGISSSASPLPIHPMVNCFKPEIPVPRIYSGCTSFIGNGISILIPRRSGILEWIRYQRMGSHKVTIELPLNWYENKDLLGFALCCVYEFDNGSAYESQIESADTSDNEPNNGSAYESQNESADTSDNEPNNGSAYESENESADTYDNEEPVEFYCNLSIRGNNQSAVVDAFQLGSYCANEGASDIVWVIFYPKVALKEAIKELSSSNQWTHFMASFGGFGRVEQCRIRLIYAED